LQHEQLRLTKTNRVLGTLANFALSPLPPFTLTMLPRLWGKLKELNARAVGDINALVGIVM
jgi:hypothetical protein